MDDLMNRRGSFVRLSAWLMLLALAVRLASPQGWMPDLKGVAEGSSIVICSAYGPMTVQLDADGNPVPGDHDDQGQGSSQPPCSFSLLSSLVEPAAADIVPTLAVSLNEVQAARTDVIAVKRRVQPFGARSPPLA
jgi:hypothetical protein